MKLQSPQRTEMPLRKMSQTSEVGDQSSLERKMKSQQAQPQPIQANPWRLHPRVNVRELKKTLLNYTPVKLKEEPVSAANVLLVGPVGSGKSSFINTVNSAFEGHVTARACTGSLENVTTKYRAYSAVDPASGRSMKFRLWDTMGLEESSGMDASDISVILRGHIQDNFDLATNSPAKDAKKWLHCHMDSWIHCLVITLDCRTLDEVTEGMKQKIKEIHVTANKLDVPQAVLLTKVDQLDPRVGADVSLVFRSPAVEDAVSKAARLVGVPRAHVLPVKNYESEGSLVPELDKLALLSLRSMLRLADDFLFNFPHEPPARRRFISWRLIIAFVIVFIAVLSLSKSRV